MLGLFYLYFGTIRKKIKLGRKVHVDLGEPTQKGGGLRNIAGMGSNLSYSRRIATSNKQTFDTPYQVKIIKNNFVDNIWGFSQVMESPLPLQYPLVK